MEASHRWWVEYRGKYNVDDNKESLLKIIKYKKKNKNDLNKNDLVIQMFFNKLISKSVCESFLIKRINF